MSYWKHLLDQINCNDHIRKISHVFYFSCTSMPAPSREITQHKAHKINNAALLHVIIYVNQWNDNNTNMHWNKSTV